MSVMSALDQLRTDASTRCANCGRSEEESGVPVTTVVIDWRIDLLCDDCVGRFDWLIHWNFDPILNVYTRS